MGKSKKEVQTDPHAFKDPPKAFKKYTRSDGLILKKSLMDMQNAGHQTRHATNVLWQHAPRCSLYMRMKTAKKNKDGKVVPFPDDDNGNPMDKRSNRALAGHSIKAFASGAAAAVGADIVAQAKLLGVKVNSEYLKYPVLPGVSPGAAIQYEAAVVAYSQELFGTAIFLKGIRTTQQKVTVKCAQAACDMVNRKLNAATGFMPTRVTASFAKPTQKEKARATKNKKDRAETVVEESEEEDE